MKLGNLVRLKDGFPVGFELYADEHIDVEKLRIGNPRCIWFQPRELGLVIDVRDKGWSGNPTNIYFRILTPQGTGWVPSHYTEVVK